MPSSYNNNLRLEMIATGEQSGTWGQTTNTNLGTLIVDAITGMTSVTTNVSPYTLTALNGTADQSRAAALQLQTSTGANFIVVVPTVTKLYVVKNVDATYSATVKTASGSGVTVPPLKSVLLRCDGTDVIEQLNQIVGNFTVGGNISIGGTTTLSGDPTLALEAATKQYVDAAAAGSSPSGALIMWPTGTAPSGWLLCNGAAVSRTTYAALFAVIGTTFGAGDTTTTFNLPDYRNRMPIGVNTIASSIGATGGSKDAIVVSHTHTASSTVSDPGHNHTVPSFTNSFNPTSGRVVTGNSQATGDPITSTSVTNISVATTVASSGASGADANMPPYLGINFIIKT